MGLRLAEQFKCFHPSYTHALLCKNVLKTTPVAAAHAHLHTTNMIPLYRTPFAYPEKKCIHPPLRGVHCRILIFLFLKLSELVVQQSHLLLPNLLFFQLRIEVSVLCFPDPNWLTDLSLFLSSRKGLRSFVKLCETRGQ